MEEIKITMLGFCAGKSAFCNRFFTNVFFHEIPATVGICKTGKNLKLPNGNKIRIIIFDTAGNERYRIISG